MECIEARALKKSSFLSEFASQESKIDDFFSINGVINGVSNDDFSVDAFLDLSNGNFSDEFFEAEEEEEKDSLSTYTQERDEKFSGAGISEVPPAGDLSVPVDDMENLEWLSQIVDDSASELSLLCPAGYYTPNPQTTGLLNRFKSPVHTDAPILCFPSTVPAKTRTKRPRTGGCSWSGGSSESSGDCSPTSTLIFSNPAWTHIHVDFENSEEVEKPPPLTKRGRKNPLAADGSGDAPPLVQRRCTHCQVQKTPQWRNGPLGPKTLCNACGVRFKSGRLFPEYRPACSPTFSGDVHSNSHRKVLEMRRKKEGGAAEEESGSKIA